MVPFVVRAIGDQPVPDHHYRLWGNGVSSPPWDPHYKVTYVKGNCDRYCCISFDCPLEDEEDKMKCIPDFERVLNVAMGKVPVKIQC